jgi:RNA polymerase sigma factor (sigma-70 family)
VDASFQQVYEEHAGAIFRYLRRVAGSRLLAEDLLQETFLKLHVHLVAGGALDNVRAWLFRVATNVARDRMRDAARATLREQAYSPPSSVVDFSRQFEQQQVIASVLRRLPPRMRQVLLLSGEGFTYKEIASITGIEPAYVGVVLHRARGAFATYFEAVHVEGRGQRERRTVR